MPDNRILVLLQEASVALRKNLHRHDLDPTARAHMERALCHAREAYVATQEGKARTVQQLVIEMEKFERLLERARQETPSAWVRIKV